MNNLERKIYTQNRELSWLNFNERVLDKSQDINVPYLERLRFLAIFNSNLDEFFMIRVAGLLDLSVLDKKQKDSNSNMTPSEQCEAIFTKCRQLIQKKDFILQSIKLADESVDHHELRFSDCSQEIQAKLFQTFVREIEPNLRSQILDAHHPFPHLPSKQIHVLAKLSRKEKQTYGLISIPKGMNRLIYPQKQNNNYLLLENVILAFTETIFDQYFVDEKTLFCVTRGADIHFSDEFDVDKDYRNSMKKLLKKRSRLPIIRIETQGKTSLDLVKFLSESTSVPKTQIFENQYSFDCSYFFSLAHHLEKRGIEGNYPLYQPKEKILPRGNVLNTYLKQESLLFYPFDSMNSFVDLLMEASVDKSVQDIRITLYRVSNPSKVVQSLIQAAENGKRVTVVIELQARFDEDNNIEVSERLEEAGCFVYYGLEELKVHSKICQITLMRNGKLKTITQIGTGNYNESTAKKYTDFSYITFDEVIGQDATLFFNSLIQGERNILCKKLLVAPCHLKSRLISFIDEEIKKGNQGEIFMKMNSLTDKEMIAKLHEASVAGVKIDLLIRGICCIIPGIKGETDNIHIHSIVGRYLEHSRVYIFGQGIDSKVYIASADMMSRNTEKRIEIACPVENKEIKSRILQIKEVLWSDNVNGTELKSDRYYHPIIADHQIDNFSVFMREREVKKNNTEFKSNFIQRFLRIFDPYKMF